MTEIVFSESTLSPSLSVLHAANRINCGECHAGRDPSVACPGWNCGEIQRQLRMDTHDVSDNIAWTVVIWCTHDRVVGCDYLASFFLFNLQDVGACLWSNWRWSGGGEGDPLPLIRKSCNGSNISEDKIVVEFRVDFSFFVNGFGIWRRWTNVASSRT